MDEFETIVSEAKKEEERIKKADPKRVGMNKQEATPFILRLEWLAQKELRAQEEKIRCRNNKLAGEVSSKIWLDSSDPLNVMLKRERQEEMLLILRGLALHLTNDEKLIYIKYYYEGYKQQEIATDLGISQAWVSKTLKSTNRKIEERKREYYNDR